MHLTAQNKCLFLSSSVWFILQTLIILLLLGLYKQHGNVMTTEQFDIPPRLCFSLVYWCST